MSSRSCVGESAPRHDRRLQRREQVRRRHAVVDARRIVGIRVRLAVDFDRASPVVVRGGHDVDRRGRLDPRHRAKTFDDVAGKPRLAVGRRVARIGQLQPHREQAVGVESLRPVQEPVNGEDTQGRGDEQRQCQRHFADDQSAAQPQPAGACRRPARAVLEGLGHARPRRLDRRHQAEDERRREGEHGREADESQVDVHLLPARDESRNLRRHVARDELEADPGHRERGRHRREREDPALEQQLARDAHPARANRKAYRHLPLPFGAARQQQAGHVRAGDEQHEDGRRLPHRQDRHEADIHHPVAERVDARHAVATGLRMIARQLLAGDSHLRFRIVERSPGSQPADRRDVERSPIGRSLGGERERSPDLRTHGEVESGRRDADDLVLLSVDVDRLRRRSTGRTRTGAATARGRARRADAARPSLLPAERRVPRQAGRRAPGRSRR